MAVHTSVLLKQAVEALNVQQGKRYIDATYGLGGHSKLIAEEGGKVLGIDWDADSTEAHMPENDSITLATGNYADIESIAKDNNFTPVHGVLFDLGLSMWQISDSGRGFTYNNEEEPLDMRINTDIALTAEAVLNTYTKDQLYTIFSKYSEERQSEPIAHAIVENRRHNKYKTVGQLKSTIYANSQDPKSIARIFQALRVEVNNEYDNILKGLQGAVNILEDDGSIVIIAFHPSEDRIIKRFIKQNNLKTTKKPLLGKSGHKKFERSAVLRVVKL